MPLTPFSPLIEDTTPAFNTTPPLSNAVGLRHLHALDASRDDISTGKRQFMVSIFYPALRDKTAPRARLTDILAPQCDAALELLARESGFSPDEKNVAFERLKSLALRARRGLAPDISKPCPVLIYYPGGLSHRLSNAALCERLAGFGYMVFALDAPRDAPMVVFPEGQLVQVVPDNDEDYIWPRVADVRFLLDCLEEFNETGEFTGLLDLSRIGMFGHSRGGYLSNIGAVEDSRIKAAVNMDGFLWGLWTEGTGLNEYPPEFQARARTMETPILRLRGDQGSEDAARRGFEAEVQDFGGDFVSIAIHGYDHGSFATTPWMCGQAKNWGTNTALLPPPPEQAHLLTYILNDFFQTYLLKGRRRMELLMNPPEGISVFARPES